MFLFQKIPTKNRFTSDFFKKIDFAIDKMKMEIFFTETCWRRKL